jgi:acyl carrier protein
VDKKTIFETLKKVLIEEFGLDPNAVVPEARLNEDLKLDSIDAVDLIVKLKSVLPKNINPAVFKEVRTLQDVVNAIYAIIQS